MPIQLKLSLPNPQDDLRAALEANTNVGGDNCGRGAVLGALIVGAFGRGTLPMDLYQKLFLKTQIREAFDRLT